MDNLTLSTISEEIYKLGQSSSWSKEHLEMLLSALQVEFQEVLKPYVVAANQPCKRTSNSLLSHNSDPWSIESSIHPAYCGCYECCYADEDSLYDDKDSDWCPCYDNEECETHGFWDENGNYISYS